MNPLDVLMPNNVGDMFDNIGVGEMLRNRGIGVKEALATSPDAMNQREQTSNPAVFRDKLRTAKAREFGKTKETVGF